MSKLDHSYLSFAIILVLLINIMIVVPFYKYNGYIRNHRYACITFCASHIL